MPPELLGSLLFVFVLNISRDYEILRWAFSIVASRRSSFHVFSCRVMCLSNRLAGYRKRELKTGSRYDFGGVRFGNVHSEVRHPVRLIAR